MFEGRAEQVDLISLLSTGEARGANSLLRVYWICVRDVAASLFTSTLSCAVSLSVKLFFQPTQLSSFVLNGKVRVMLITCTICSLKSVKSRDGTRERTCLRDIIRAELSWDLCLRGLSGW